MSLDPEEIERLDRIKQKNGRRGADWSEDELILEEEYGDLEFREYSHRFEFEYEGESIEVPRSNSSKFLKTFWTAARRDVTLRQALKLFYETRSSSNRSPKARELESFVDENYKLPEELGDSAIELIDSEDLIRRYQL